METSWKSIVPYHTIEISVPITDYHQNKDDLDSFYAKNFLSQFTNINSITTLKKSTDARKPTIKYNLRLGVYTDLDYPKKLENLKYPPLNSKEVIHIIGFGPAGIFAAIKCLMLGIKPIVIERGKPVNKRRRDVAVLNRSGVIDSESNYCFGEGGAGTFSDGKLYTRSHKRGKIQEILDLFVLHGADPAILYEAHPHIGTNKLPHIIENLRETIIQQGGEVRFEQKLTEIKLLNNRVNKIAVNHKWESCQTLLLATGHSARDVYMLLHKHKISLEAKPFAMGFRIEHPQSLINTIQYHSPENAALLPPASYSLVCQVKNKGVFSFCMCPGGVIAPAATDKNEVVVNGWSPSKRNGKFANSGWVTEIGEKEWKEFAQHGALAGLKFQKSIEEKAYQLGGGQSKVPAQNLTDFLADRPSATLNKTSYHPGVTPADLNTLYPHDVTYRLREGLREMTKKLNGFNHELAIVTAPESRTSAPVRIPRTAMFCHPEIQNLFPCGEGAGYAGGIISAALDGFRVVQAINELK